MFGCGLKFKSVKGYNGLGSRSTELILNISVNLKQVSSAFKLARLFYNTVSIKMPYYSRIILNSFTTDCSQNYSGLIDAYLHMSHYMIYMPMNSIHHPLHNDYMCKYELIARYICHLNPHNDEWWRNQVTWLNLV